MGKRIQYQHNFLGPSAESRVFARPTQSFAHTPDYSRSLPQGALQVDLTDRIMLHADCSMSEPDALFGYKLKCVAVIGNMRSIDQGWHAHYACTGDLFFTPLEIEQKAAEIEQHRIQAA
ncbi:hypothetical protein ACJX0J_024387 [Zea mays]